MAVSGSILVTCLAGAHFDASHFKILKQNVAQFVSNDDGSNQDDREERGERKQKWQLEKTVIEMVTKEQKLKQMPRCEIESRSKHVSAILASDVPVFDQTNIGHIARTKDTRWTKHCTEGQVRRGKRSRGQPSRRWQEDIAGKEGTTCKRKATEGNGSSG